MSNSSSVAERATLADVAKGLATLGGVLADLRKDMDALKSNGVVRETAAPTHEPAPTNGAAPGHELSDAEVREYVKAHSLDLSVKGRWVSNATRDAVRAHMANGGNGATTNGNGTSNRFGADVSVRERDGVQISTADAAEALRTHPMRDKIGSITQKEWATIAQMGAYLKYTRIKNADGTFTIKGDPNGGTRPNPGNINGFDRRQAKTLSRQEPKDRKVWTVYQGCLVLAKLEAAGFKF